MTINRHSIGSVFATSMFYNLFAGLPSRFPVFFVTALKNRVGWGSDQDRSDLETAGVAAQRRGFPNRENADLGRRMPFFEGH
jgi:hypothetical protein